MRNRPSASATAARLREVVWSIDPSQAVFGVSSMDRRVAASTAEIRFSALLMTFIALLAAILALLGVYGVVSFMTGQRTREMGIRLSLGATGRQLLELVLGQALYLALAGLGLGVAGALALRHFVATFLFGVSATDPWIFLTVGGLMIALVLLAAFIPARRLTKVDPVEALRCD